MNQTPTEFDEFANPHDDEPAPVPRRSAESAPTASSAPSAVEPREISTTPEGTPEPSGTWQRVVKAPPSVIDPDPVADAGLPDAPPPIPRVVKIIGLAGTAVLLVVAAWLGLSLGGPGPGPTSSDSPGIPEPTYSWELTPPAVLNAMVQGATTTTEDPADPNRVVVRSDYSDGRDQLILLLTRPETDLPSLILDAGVSDVEAVGESICGTSVDTGYPVCARVADRTGIMVMGVTDLTVAELDIWVDAFLRDLSGA